MTIQKSYGDGFVALVILQGNDSSFDGAPTMLADEMDAIVKFERQLREEDGVFGSAKFHYGGLLQARLAIAPRRDLNRDANRGKLRKEARELLRAFPFFRCSGHVCESPLPIGRRKHASPDAEK